jgi:hypothetical protein
MKRFTSPRHAQRLLSTFGRTSPHFCPRQHLLSATGWRHEMADRFTVWNEITPGEHDRRLNVNWDRAFHPNDAQHNTRTISPPIDLMR